MFARRAHHDDSFSKYRATKSTGTSRQKRSFREHAAATKKPEKPKRPAGASPIKGSTMTSPIVTIVVGQDARLFAAHEDVLSASPFFSAIIRGQFLESHSKRVTLSDEIPEIFSSVLEYLYKGDYYPRLLHNKRQDRWELEDTSPTSPSGGVTRGHVESTVYSPVDGQLLLKDTLLYCTAEKYGLEDLKRLALRKQGLQSGIQCATILASARFAYANTPDSDSKLRAHYLALIIRSRGTFKRSGTMQMEMERGGKLFFDLFCALSNHLDDMAAITKSPRTPR